MANGHGGRRKGSGRLKGGKNSATILADEARRQLIEEALANWRPLIQAWIRVGLGDYYVETTREGQKFVYKAAPSAKAIKDVTEFVIGKAVQPVWAKVDGDIRMEGLQELTATVRKILEPATTPKEL